MVPELPQLRTARLLLRRPRPDDLDFMVGFHTDPANYVYDPPPPAERIRSVFGGWLTAWDEHGICYWMVEELDDGELIGHGGIRPFVEDGEHVLNLAYRLESSHRGRGYATELARAAVGWAEANQPDVPLSIVTRPENTPSLRVADKLGFKRHRTRDSGGFPEVLLRRPSGITVAG